MDETIQIALVIAFLAIYSGVGISIGYRSYCKVRSQLPDPQEDWLASLLGMLACAFWPVLFVILWTNKNITLWPEKKDG